MKKVILIAVLMVSNVAFATEPSWSIIGAKVRSVDYGQEYGGNYVLRIGLSDFNFSSLGAGCSLTSTHGIIGRASNSHSRYSLGLASIAMSAQAQDLLVDVLIDRGNCSDSSNYKNIDPNGQALPTGYGYELRAIRIRSE